MPRKKGFYSLKKPRIRQSWNKYNLYNLWHLKHWSPGGKTFFQQKWAAKSLTRSYHGEQIRERSWNNLFSRYIPSVVSMDPRVLAQSDGSDMAAGRGAGKSTSVIEKRPEKNKITPYMGMVYWPMERRLDTAIFRALFASSARQARQMVVHGFVKVNGTKMRFPGYLLNPGDMFSVEPEMVLFATGKHKGDKTYNAYIGPNQPAQQEDDDDEEDDIDEEEAEESEPDHELSSNESEQPPVVEEDPAVVRKKALLALRKDIKHFEEKQSDKLSAKRKQKLRQLRKEAAKLLSKLHLVDDALIDTFQTDFAAVVATVAAKPAKATEHDAELATDAQAPSQQSELTPPPSKSPSAPPPPPRADHAAALAAALSTNVFNPLKRYKTPWEPRPLMSAFAFIPRYLEVNQNVCSAVYLRHPVARPGLCEVPSPFSLELSQLAHNWYLRRR